MKAKGYKTFLPGLALLGTFSTLSAVSFQAVACGDGAYIGQVCTMATTFCPRNTLEMNGQLLPISSNSALFSLMGCEFGGDCRTTFALPDMRGRAAVGYGQGPGLAMHPFGQRYGQEQVTQTTAMLANHGHQATLSGAGASVSVQASTADGTHATPAAGDYIAIPNDGGRTPVQQSAFVEGSSAGSTVALGGVSAAVTGGSVSVANTGGSQPIPTTAPRVAMRYCVVTQGLFPPRD